MTNPNTQSNKPSRRRIAPILAVIALCLVLTGAIMFTCSLIGRSSASAKENKDPHTGGNQGASSQDPAVYGDSIPIEYAGKTLMSIPTVDISPYSPDDFTVEASGKMTYTPTPAAETFAGVDVSSHQENIDWAKVKADGIDFAIIRAGYRGYTEGGIFLDNTFYENMRGAKKAGLNIGVYFFSQAITVAEAEEEAEQLLKWIKPYDITYPVVFDWEFMHASDARTQDMSGELLGEIANAFCKKIEDSGYKPMIYFNRELAYIKYDISDIDNYPFWLAEYDGAPTFYYHYEMLQYTSGGKVDGIEGDVDLNISFVDYSKA